MKAAAAAKEDVSNGKFLERVGIDVDKALPEIMIKKLKVLQFSKEEAADIMQNRAKIDGAKEEAVAAAMKAANLITSAAIDAGNDPFTAEGGLVNIPIAVPTDGFEKDTKRFYSHYEFYCWSRIS